jgi:FMN reductase
VLTEIGGTVPGRGLYVVDSRYEDPAAYDGWLADTRPVVRALLEARERALA